MEIEIPSENNSNKLNIYSLDEDILATYIEIFSQYDDAIKIVIKDKEDAKNSD